MLTLCVSCKGKEKYKVRNYLSDLAYTTGISISNNEDDSFNDLIKWEVITDEDIRTVDDPLTYAFISKTIERFLNIKEGLEYLKKEKIIDSAVKEGDYCDIDNASKIIAYITSLLNNPIIEDSYEIKEKDNIKRLNEYQISDNKLYTDKELKDGDCLFLEKEDKYVKVKNTYDTYYEIEEPSIDEVFNSLEIAGSSDIDLEKAEIVPYEEEIRKTNYINNKYELLSNNRHSFAKDGFDVSYSFKKSGIDVRISKQKNNRPNIFFDISLLNIKPTYKWKYNNGKIENAFFKVDYKLTNELGVSTGKYNNYYLDLKDKDSPSFLGFVKGTLKSTSKEDEIEATIPICKIKTPIPNVPAAYFNIDVIAKLYVTGKIEVNFYNNGTIGFEINNNRFRVIHDVNNDTDFIVGASARAVAGINFNLEAAKYRLMDMEIDGGVRAAVSSTIHIYDSEGNMTSEDVDIPYSILDTVSKENENVRICGDVSLNWVLDLDLNTSKTIPYKYGLTYSKSFLGNSNQIFKNKTHIENWQFVKSCTRKSRLNTSKNNISKANSNKIVLQKYSAVVIKGDSYKIPITSIPSGYTENDLTYYSNNPNIASCSNGIIEAKEIGSTSIEISTKDNKYKASINILVSTG